jgi:hypothetical protein
MMLGTPELRKMKTGHFRAVPKNGDTEICSAKVSCENQGGGVNHGKGF